MLNIDFLSPMTYDDRLDIEVAVDHVGEGSFSLSVRARKQDRALTFQARLVQVCVSAETMRPVSLPDDLRAKLEA
jgi:acyl-CoA thioester hydrolase